jgi:mono/diheme cytochrome c family protein
VSLRSASRLFFTGRLSFIGCVLVLGAFLTAPQARSEGRSENFETYCSVCHGDDGKGQTGEGKKKGARDLTNAKWQASMDDKRFVKSITKGHDKMPAFGKKLSAEEILALVKEVRSLAAKKRGES